MPEVAPRSTGGETAAAGPGRGGTALWHLANVCTCGGNPLSSRWSPQVLAPSAPPDPAQPLPITRLPQNVGAAPVVQSGHVRVGRTVNSDDSRCHGDGAR